MVRERAPEPSRPRHLPSDIPERRELLGPTAAPGRILVADDQARYRSLLSEYLGELGYEVVTARDGEEALELLDNQAFDAMLLDIVMPKLTGFEVLQKLREDGDLGHLPVIVISTLDDMDSVIQCIEAGATDYLPHPLNPVLLRARLESSLTSKRFHDLELAYLNQVREARIRSDELLGSILPASIAERLKAGETNIAEHFSATSVLFADLVDFTPYAAETEPAEVVATLNRIFSAFDRLIDQHAVEKIKTVGDEYMVASGLPIPNGGHAMAIADFALEMLADLERLNDSSQHPMNVRIGIHSGPVVAGVVGTSKPAYDLWGDTVNIAHRMQSSGIEGGIVISNATLALLRNRYLVSKRPLTEIKGRGNMQTYRLLGAR